jgi:hypothetical protein
MKNRWEGREGSSIVLKLMLKSIIAYLKNGSNVQ